MQRLSDEQKQRIEGEEAELLALEAYRQEVRRRIRSGQSGTRLWVLLFLFAAAIVAYVVLDRRGMARLPKTAEAERTPFMSTETMPLLSDSFRVPAGDTLSWTVTVNARQENARIVGSFEARGGSQNDIEAAIGQPMEIENWMNGHEGRVFWSSNGKKTAGAFEVRLPRGPGSYKIALSNRFSVFSSKDVRLKVDLVYDFWRPK